MKTYAYSSGFYLGITLGALLSRGGPAPWPVIALFGACAALGLGYIAGRGA